MRTRRMLMPFALGLALALVFLGILNTGQSVGSTALTAGTRYVATTGDDAGNDCTSQAAPCRTIQHAVDAASSGDTIKVAAGTYTDVHVRPRNDATTTGVVTQVVYVSRTVTIRGGYTTSFSEPPKPGVNTTTLDAQGQGRVFYITNEANPTITGLRITGGDATGLQGRLWADAGGGVYVFEAGVIMDGCAICCNTAGTVDYGYGGGLYAESSSVAVSETLVENNAANTTYGTGGGLHCYESHVVLNRNTFDSNSTTHRGGGVEVAYGSGTLTANTFTSNTANSGGGVYVGNSESITLWENVLRDNEASSGGGLSGWNSNGFLISGNSFTANTGGGVSLGKCDATIVNNLMTGNQSSDDGSGLSMQGSSVDLVHNTVARNTGSSGVLVEEMGGPDPIVYGAATMTNTILVGHTVGISVAAGNTATLEATLWGSGDWANDEDWSGAGAIVTGTHNTWGDPAFVNPDAGDYHLTSGSAAIDEGVETDVDVDIDGDPRPIGPHPDLGADEAWQQLFLPLVMQDYIPLPTDVHGPGFADYTEITVTLPEAYEGYTLPVDLAALGNRDAFILSEPQTTLMAQNGFVASPADWLEFFELYQDAEDEDLPVFVTTDSVYHVYHLLFDKMLRDLEREHFEPDIHVLTAACRQSAHALYDDLLGTELEEPARSVLAYFAVAEALIDPEAVAPPAVADLVEAELALIETHAGFAPSPIFCRDCPQKCVLLPCLCEDYSQYVPRGHYTRSEQLRRYFRTMMWYGRINLRLAVEQETRAALLITHILRHTDVDGDPAADVWARVYDPTAFIVGKADDLGFHEYGALWDAVFGPDAPVTAIADPSALETFVEAARRLPPPQINSMWVYIWEDMEKVTQGFRFMGQRFVLDAYIFQQLIYSEVSTDMNPRMLPKALDVMAALGSQEAYALLDAMGETAYDNYPAQMTKLRDEVSALQLDSWTQSLYWNWLYALDPLLEPKEGQYPSFMRTPAWRRKDLNGVLGSWTELKHDTILYAKQTQGDISPPPGPPPPPGWVEPNPRAYARLLALTRMTYDGLVSRDLLTEQTEDNLTDLDGLLTFLLDASQRELAGAPLTEDDYRRIEDYGDELEELTVAAADAEEGQDDPAFEEDKQAALVADVATSGDGRVLEEAIGRIFEIYVVVPDGSGGLHIAKGGVFSYYEFPWPASDRLTDEAWQAMLEAGQAPDRPAWTTSYVAERFCYDVYLPVLTRGPGEPTIPPIPNP